MNKKANTLLFILGATVFNILVVIVCFIILTLLYVKFLMPVFPDEYSMWGFSLIFFSSMAISFLVYRIVLKFLISKIDIEKYFDPLFVKKYRKQK